MLENRLAFFLSFWEEFGATLGRRNGSGLAAEGKHTAAVPIREIGFMPK